MDWHASVYGSRSGGGQYRDFSDGDADDDGVTYGARGSYADMADDTAGATPLPPSVDDAELRRLGGNAVYFRAKDVLKSGRMHDMAVSFNVPDSPRTSGTMLTGAWANVRLTALVKGADRYADDYRVSAAIDTDAGKVGQSSCTCPAYGRFRGVCKHVIALVMAYNEHPDDFAAADDGNGSTNGIGRGAAGLVPRQPAVRTTRALDLFMRQQDDERTRRSQSRQLDLLKEIGGLADSGGVAGAAQTARFMPIASVSLRLSLSFSLNSCVAKFRIEVPSRGISYVVKDIASLLQSVKNREFVAYGKKLAFVHSRDAFDERSRNLLDVLSRAQDIRAVINNDNSAYSYYYRRQSDDATLTLSDGEVAELLDTYVGTEDTVEYTAPARFYAPTMRVSVVDGNPDLGLAMERGDDPEASNGSTAAAGYVIRHAQRVERFIEGQRSHYVIARPFSQAESGAGVGSGGRALLSVDRATIYRCDADFAQKRALLSLLCGENDREAMYLSESDVDRFVRTVLPQLVSRQENEVGRSVDAIGASDGPNAEDGSAASSVFDRLVPPAGRETGVPAHGGLIIDVPPELLAKMRVPCRLAFYLDRDRAGVTCDAQAHYGDKHYHVFDGVGVDASMRDKEMERLAVEAMLHYFPRPSGAVAAIPESDDEAQYIKNAATKVSKAVRSVTAVHRFALTGTPIENRLSELWSIFDFLMPGMLGSYAHFRERFEMPVLSGDETAQKKLQSFVGPFILRRLKSQVLKDLPDKIENVITVQLQGEQRKLYAALEQQLRSVILRQRPADFNTGKIQILAQLTRLRQVCCDPRLIYENADGHASALSAGVQSAAKDPQQSVKQPVKQSKARKTVSSAKLDAIIELVDSCRDAGRKMLIFSQFTSYLDLIAQRLRADGVEYDMITGATPKKRRLELVDRFNADATPVFLISLKAGNTGLNLTGACVVVHADPWWNAAAQDQATDRAHRIGQTQDVNVYQIVAKDTIEERILNLQRSKTDLAQRFVDSASSATGRSMAALTKDDLLALLG